MYVYVLIRREEARIVGVYQTMALAIAAREVEARAHREDAIDAYTIEGYRIID